MSTRNTQPFQRVESNSSSPLDDVSSGTPSSGVLSSISGRFVLKVTQDDFYWSKRSGLNNPLLCALQRQTKTLWRMYDDGFAIEAMTPFRVCQLPEEAMKKQRQWEEGNETEEIEWEVQMVQNGEQG